MGYINYNFDVNGDLKKEMIAGHVRYSQIASELQVKESVVREWLRIPLSEENEKKIRSAMKTVLNNRDVLGEQKPNQDFRDELQEQGISIYKLSDAVGLHHQTVRMWLSVPLTPEHLMILRNGVRLIHERRGW